MKIYATRVIPPGFSSSTEGETAPWVIVMKLALLPPTPEDSEASWVADMKMGDDPRTPELRRDHLPPPTENDEASWTTHKETRPGILEFLSNDSVPGNTEF